MASQPAQLARRRSSPIEESSSAPAQQSYDSPSTDSTTEVILLNPPRSAAASSSSAQQRQTPAQTAAPPPEIDQEVPETRRCWICQGDDNEDLPGQSAWRTPCPCALTAHEECLLEWISNEEAPRPGQIARNHVIKCPQCKAVYKIQRPRDYLVAVADLVQKFANSLIIPTTASAIVGCIYSGFFVYGLNSMQMVFGFEKTKQLLAPAMRSSIALYRTNGAVRTVSRLIGALDPFFPGESGASFTLMCGLPLIAPSLILLRTRVADQAFALLLPLYFLKESNRNVTHWPPTPGLAFATIPYLRTAYNGLYQQLFYKHEKRWDAAVQRKPREGETPEQIAAAAAEEENHALFEIRFDHEVEIGEAAQINQQNRPQNINPPAQNQNQNNQAQNNDGWEIRQNIPTGQLISTVMGALFFPTISSIMGDILKYTLPSHLVTSTLQRPRGLFSGSMRVVSKGLLKEKWGRSLVGGCLFVVLKDVITLYCKWKKARDFGKRKVLDYMGERAKGGVTR